MEAEYAHLYKSAILDSSHKDYVLAVWFVLILEHWPVHLSICRLVFMMLEIKLGKYSTTELPPHSISSFLKEGLLG